MLKTDEKEHANIGLGHFGRAVTPIIELYLKSVESPTPQHLHTSTDAVQRVPGPPKHPRHTPNH